MTDREFPDAALVLVAHGSSVNADAAGPALRQAAALRRHGSFARVEAAFWKQAPNVCPIVEALTESRVFIVPLMISDGYFSGQRIPEALGFALDGPGEPPGGARRRQHGGQTWFYCPPIGTHPRMADLLVQQAREIVTRFPFPRAPRPEETALAVAGHGTARNPNSRVAIEAQAERIRSQGLYAEVQAVFLEESPRIGDVYRLTTRPNLVVTPFFVSDGLHAAADIPVLLGEREELVRERLRQGQGPWRNPTERHGRRVWYAAGIGDAPLITEVILERVREAARQP